MNRQNEITGAIDRANIVIVGNGIAGLTAAVEARRLDPEASIVMMTDQIHPTINTPALKQFAVGKLTREQLLAYPTGTESKQRIHVVNAHVEEIHAQENYISLAAGLGFGYDSLLLATGSKPMGLPSDLLGQDLDGVLTLHRLNDYLNLRRRLNEIEKAVVVGAGVHAIETIMGLLYLGIQVHWLVRDERILSNIMDKEASEMILESLRHAGARVYTGTEIVGIVGRVGAVTGVVTTRQRILPCQLVLACTGTAPVTTLAKRCDIPMKEEKGILVDDQFRTSVRNIYAAGDVVALRDPLTGKYAPRALWYAAVSQGRAVAMSMTGVGEPEPFGVNWHGTRVGEYTMLTVGNPLDSAAYITPLTEQRKRGYTRLALVDDRLVGYLSLGSRQPDSLAIKRLIDEGLSVRDIQKELLRGEFDARRYFFGKRTYAVARMITTGQVPTPLLSVRGIAGGEKRAVPLISGQESPLVRRARMPESPLPLYTREPESPLVRRARVPESPLPLCTREPRSASRIPRQVELLPLSTQTQTGPFSSLFQTGGPRQSITRLIVRSPDTGAQANGFVPPGPDNPPVDERQRRIPAPKTPTGDISVILSAPSLPVARGEQAGKTRVAELRDVSRVNDNGPVSGHLSAQKVSADPIHVPNRQFIKSPAPLVNSERNTEPNPHPTRSLWHFIDR